MSDRKIIAVVGATGAQGGGLVRAIAAHPDGGFTARAITRDPSSDAAKALAALPNVEVVQADSDDQASLERAFAGCHGVFAVTFFWVDFSPEHEMAQARNMAAAAKAAGVHHVVWSTLEDTRHWVAETRCRRCRASTRCPTSTARRRRTRPSARRACRRRSCAPLLLGELHLLRPRPGARRGRRARDHVPDGNRALPAIAAEDIGKTRTAIFARGDEFIGQTVSITGEQLSGSQLAEKMAAALGEEVRYNDVDADVYRSFGFPGADEVGNMFQFKRDCEAQYVGARENDLARTLNPELQDFDAWLAANASRIPLG